MRPRRLSDSLAGISATNGASLSATSAAVGRSDTSAGGQDTAGTTAGTGASATDQD